jgi:hypothetical protein
MRLQRVNRHLELAAVAAVHCAAFDLESEAHSSVIDDNSLVAWYRIKEERPVNTLSALVLQHQQLPLWYRRLISMTAQDVMFELFVQA